MTLAGTDVTIELEETDSGGRFVARTDCGGEGNSSGAEAELTFSKAGTARIIADHTGVPRSMGGQGIGTKLVERLHEHAVERGLKVVALCPFVKAQMAKHPEWRDVLDA